MEAPAPRERPGRIGVGVGDDESGGSRSRVGGSSGCGVGFAPACVLEASSALIGSTAAASWAGSEPTLSD